MIKAILKGYFGLFAIIALLVSIAIVVGGVAGVIFLLGHVVGAIIAVIALLGVGILIGAIGLMVLTIRLCKAVFKRSFLRNP